VHLNQVLHSIDFKNFVGHLPLVLGQDSIGSTVIVDLAVMPHLLVAGSTGSGKSVALNTMLVSLLCKHSPEILKLILIDPKRLEFASYADIPHLLVPIVTDPRKAALVLKWVVKTMEERYALMEECNVRNIFDYHSLAHNNAEMQSMPFIVIMIDELSDLMMTAPKETEDLIARITQMARAAGIHMVVATQRPSVDVITGLIKVNFPSRISFRVTSKIDSRTILDCNGADKLLGKGDMLFLDSSSRLKRAHAAFVSDKEIEKLVNHIRLQQSVEYIDISAQFATQTNDDGEVDDQLYYDVLRFIESVDEVSISLLQRKFRIGYNRSARIIDKLESQGIIMQEPGGKTRKVIR
jgi:DNA segregation ATPase FtsK/SpoIIIE, S-DNA-T family